MRRYTFPAVYNRRYRSCKLQRRDLKRLAEGHCGKFHISDRVFLMHDRSRFPGQIHAGLIQKPELFQVIIIAFRADPEPQRDKYRVAGIADSLCEIFRSMSSHLVASYPSVIHNDKARTAEGTLGRHRSRLQSGSRRDNLKGGTRLIGIIDAAVPPHPVQLFLLQFLLCLLLLRRRLPGCFIRCGRLLSGFLLCAQRLIFRRQRIGLIQVKLRHIHHRHDLPVFRVHHDQRYPVGLLCRHNLLCELGGITLDIIVQTDDQVVSRHRLLPSFTGGFYLDSRGIGQGQDHPLLPAQILVIDHFKADDPLIVAARKPEHLGSKSVIGIIPFIVFIHLHPRQIRLPDLVSEFFGHIAAYPLHG